MNARSIGDSARAELCVPSPDGGSFVPTPSVEKKQHWLSAERLRFYSVGVLICYGVWLVVYFYKAVWHPREYIHPLALDFLPFWSASQLALHGHAADAYNQTIIEQIERAAINHEVGILPWLYPPMFLLAVYPLALLPWKVAAVAFLGGTYALFVKAIHTIVPRREAVLVAMAFPAAALVMVSGQNGLLTASLAAFGLNALKRRPVLAGFCFGVLSMKPQLAMLFALALLCSRSWRALAALAATSLGMLAVALIAFGTETLAAFVHNMGMAAGYVEEGRAALARVPSAFAMIKLAHGPTALAYAAQAVSAAMAIAAVYHAWHREASHELRCAILVCASLMMSPYLFDYDLTWYGVLIAWYARHAMNTFWQRGEREWLLVLWLVPFAGILLVMRIHIQFMPIVSAATLWMLCARLTFEGHAAARAANTGRAEHDLQPIPNQREAS
jgi:Glycosyltransferase family 87